MTPQNANSIISASVGVILLATTLLLWKMFGAEYPLTVAAATALLNYASGLVQVPPGKAVIPATKPPAAD